RRAQVVAEVGGEARLVLARFGEMPAALLDFVEQPDVLDGDRSLVGEGGYQFDLLVGERPNLLPVDHDYADQFIVLEHRHADCRSRPAEFYVGAWFWRSGVVLGVEQPLGVYHLVECRSRPWLERAAFVMRFDERRG